MTKRFRNRRPRKHQRSPGRQAKERTSTQSLVQISAAIAAQDPPRRVENFLHFVLPRGNSATEIGDLAEHYRKLQPRFGTRCAEFWYYKETCLLLCSKIPKVLKGISYGWVEELIRKHVS